MWLIVRVNVGVMIVRLRSCQGHWAVVLAKYGILFLMMRSMVFLRWCEISSVPLIFSILSPLNRTCGFLLPLRFSFISIFVASFSLSCIKNLTSLGFVFLFLWFVLGKWIGWEVSRTCDSKECWFVSSKLDGHCLVSIEILCIWFPASMMIKSRTFVTGLGIQFTTFPLGRWIQTYRRVSWVIIHYLRLFKVYV